MGWRGGPGARGGGGVGGAGGRAAGGVVWRALPEPRELLLGAEGLRLREWRADGRARVVKHAGHRTVYQVRLPGLHFYLKHNRAAGARARLRGWLRPGKARAEY